MNKRSWLKTATFTGTATLMGMGTSLLGACSSPRPTVPLSPEEKRLEHKFRGIYGVVTRFDAVTDKHWVSVTTNRGAQIDGSGLLNLRNVKNSSYGATFPIPVTLRATWRMGSEISGDRRTGGPIIGDYTVPVAERIPDEVLDFIRANGGSLMLKVRLVDDGVLIGWAVQFLIPFKEWKPNKLKLNSGLNLRMVGGDFKVAGPVQWFEAPAPQLMAVPLSPSDQALVDQYHLMVVGTNAPPWAPSSAHRKVFEKGWYVDKKTGQRVYTEY